MTLSTIASVAFAAVQLLIGLNDFFLPRYGVDWDTLRYRRPLALVLSAAASFECLLMAYLSWANLKGPLFLALLAFAVTWASWVRTAVAARRESARKLAGQLLGSRSRRR